MEKTIYLTPKTSLVNIIGAWVSVKRFGAEKVEIIDKMTIDGKQYGKKSKNNKGKKCKSRESELAPNKQKTRKLMAKVTEVKWNKHPKRGSHTQYSFEEVTDKQFVNQ